MKNRKRSLKQYGFGAEDFATGGVAGNSPLTGVVPPWMGFAQQGIGIMDNVINLLESNPNAYSKEPTVNASTMRGMISPYATGGQVPIEVEGGEVVETPDGQLAQVEGSKHEAGGVDLAVPEGTKIYSDRLMVDGKTMQQRKKSRERQLNKLNKLLEKNPTDAITKNSYYRSKEVIDREEEQDMNLQKAANTIMQSGSKMEAAYGGRVDPPTKNPLIDYLNNWINNINPPRNITVPFSEDYIPQRRSEYIPTIEGNTAPPVVDVSARNPIVNGNIPFPVQQVQSKGSQVLSGIVEDIGNNSGDYLGIAGNLFNAIAPIVNTNKARNNTKPNINRFKGYGKDAIDANDAAQRLAATTKGSVMTDIDSATNTAFARNRASASSLNTIRILDTITESNKNKAKVAANETFANQMMNLLSQRGQLENDQDRTIMSAESQRDQFDKADDDNYYTNMAENLVNFGTNLQGIGGALNVAKSNRVNAELLAQLSQFGLTYDKKGRLVTKK